MYGSKITAYGNDALQSMQQPPIPQAPPSRSEIESELESLHHALGRLESLKNDLRNRVAPVSASGSDTAGGAAQAVPSPSSEVARAINGAGHRVHHVCNELQEAIDLLRC